MKIVSKELLAKRKPQVAIPAGLDIRQHVREIGRENGALVYEFVGTDTFGSEWSERRQYEVEAGRDEEPILFEPVYDVIRNANLPKNIDIQRIGPGGVVFEEVLEGGEVKFSSVESSEATVRIRHYGAGIEYHKDVVVFNELWRVPIVERQAGIAYNALLNHIAFNPFLTASYTAANQTAANTGGATTQEDYWLTIEDAITAAKTDTSNPRRGPYYLLVASADLFAVEKALRAEVQQGFAEQSSARDMIRGVIAYDGWTGTRGAKSTTYSGVSSGTGYLISLQYMQDHQFYFKQDLDEHGMQEDVSRFMTQVVYDTYFGAYAAPLQSTEEITWPS